MHKTCAQNNPFRSLLAAFALTATLLAAGACKPTYPNCEEDGDCKTGEFCVNQLCQQCRADADCGAGKTCNAGACQDTPGYCTSTSDCGAGQDCVENRCTMRESTPTSSAEPVQSAGPCELSAVYFQFDSSTLEADARDAIAKNAQCIRERAIGSLKVTGYTDPRGTEEYNLALGDRRARSVEQYLQSLGVEKGNLSTSSMGEEMARGEDESGWARDRRVEFIKK